MARPWSLPASLPSGDLMPYMSARRRHEIADIVFESCGGIERMTAWADRSDANYETFLTKIWIKGSLRAANPEEQASANDVESLLARLDAGEHAMIINGDDLKGGE